jgi:DNA-binding CsgD family transcriptional regulator
MLTVRETQWLRLCGEGFGTFQIAIVMGLSESYAKKQPKKIYAKLGISTRYEAWLKAIELGLVACPCGRKPCSGL